jgi:hypothetical protein
MVSDRRSLGNIRTGKNGCRQTAKVGDVDHWAYDFVFDTCADGAGLQYLSVARGR